MVNILRRIYHSSAVGHMLLIPSITVFNFCRFRLIPEELFLKWRFKLVFGRALNLVNPRTFNEKVQWLKLHDRTPLHTQCADKFAVRQYIAKKVGPEYLVPLLYHTEDTNDICPKNLPDAPFVIKTNHVSGGVTLVRDKNAINWRVVRKSLRKLLRTNYYHQSKEWQYKDIKPCILVERMLIAENGDVPSDFKLHCINGKLVFVQVDINRYIEHKRNIYDKEWNLLDCEYKYPNGEPVAEPKQFGKMKQLGELIASNFIYVRVDFYEVDNRIYIGELTFHSESGFGTFTPEEWDRKLGDMIILPSDHASTKLERKLNDFTNSITKPDSVKCVSSGFFSA